MIGMEKNTLLYELKKTIPDFLDINGNFKKIPTGGSVKHNLTIEKVRLFESFITLLRDTPIIHEETRIYIFDKYISYSGVAEQMTALRKKKVTPSYVNGAIYRSRNRLEKMFSKNIVRDILDGRELDKYKVLIGQAYIQYSTESAIDYRDNILLPLDRNIICDNLDARSFDLFLNTIKPYINSNVARLSREIDRNIIGYFNFIMSSPVLKDIDRERKNFLLRLIVPAEEASPKTKKRNSKSKSSQGRVGISS